MGFAHLAGATVRALSSRKSGPSLYDLCDPLLREPDGGDPHLRKFYKTALANPALRPLLARAGLPQLNDAGRFAALQEALRAARDDTAPDWDAIGRPLAALIDEFPQSRPRPATALRAARLPARGELDHIIRACARHLLRAFAKNRFIPAYAAFNLAGDPDLHGRDVALALRELNARTYKNATLLFNLARPFVLGSPPLAALINPPWRGVAEPMWAPVQIRHRSAYYDAFFAEALMDFCGSGLANAEDTKAADVAIGDMVRFCLQTSRESVPGPTGGAPFSVVTALAPPPHARMSRFFWQLKSDLGFGTYVPDCDTTACSLSAATQYGAKDSILDQPMLDFYAGYQVGGRSNRHVPTVAINDNIDFAGGVATWIENAAGDRPFGNDLDPTLNLDVLELAFRNHARWRVVEEPRHLGMLQAIVRFQARLVESGEFTNPRSHIYYLPELYCAYFGRCWQAFRAMPQHARDAIDPAGSFDLIRRGVLGYVCDDLIANEINPFDAALALLALTKLGGPPETFAPALACLAECFGEGGRTPYKAYEWNKMKTPTRILVGGREVTSAFVLSALVHARRAATHALSG
jgi:hypothetical protein